MERWRSAPRYGYPRADYRTGHTRSNCSSGNQRPENSCSGCWHRPIALYVGKDLKLIEQRGTVIRAMAFRDDGRSLAVLSNDQKVNVYEVPGGTLQAVIPLTSPGVDISFNASGTKPGIWTRQRSEIVYREEIMGTGDLMKAGCEMVRRNMSQEEWKRYFPDQPMQGNV